MSIDPHPAPGAGDPDLPGLTLVLPAGMDAEEILAGLARAVCQARAELARWTWHAHDNLAQCAAAGDQLGQALCRGRLLAGEHAVAHLDEAIIEQFSLWDQYRDQVPGRPGSRGCPAPGTGSGPPEPGGPLPGA